MISVREAKARLKAAFAHLNGLEPAVGNKFLEADSHLDGLL